MDIQILIAEEQHTHFALDICNLIKESAKVRGTGIAHRKVDYVEQKINSGNAVIAFQDDVLVGFCYIEIWDHGKYVANSGLVVNPDFRKLGMARKIKRKAFELARNKYPSAKIFGITTSAAVMKINSELGYIPVSFAELTKDDTFWSGCKSCTNYDILQRNNQNLCLCTGMLALSKDELLQQQSNEQNHEHA